MASTCPDAYCHGVGQRWKKPKRESQPTPEPVDVLLVCSAGGHLLQLYLLRDAWRGMSHAWVSLEREDARSLLSDETVFYAYGPTTRSLLNHAARAS